VISDQIIEHLKDPQKAIKESYRALKEDGIAISYYMFHQLYPSLFKRFLAILAGCATIPL